MDLMTRVKKKFQFELKKRFGIDISTPKVYRPPLDVHINKETLGTNYGDWTFCPDHLNAQSIIYSCGVGEDISWDIALIEKYGVQIHAFDPTPKSISFLEAQTLPWQFNFHPYGIAERDTTLTFHPPENPDHVSHTLAYKPDSQANGFEAVCKRIPTLTAELQHEHIDILKLDIEGAEYSVIDDVLKSDLSIGQILIEFHHNVANISIHKTIRTTKKLQNHGYKLFHVSDTANELSFIRR